VQAAVRAHWPGRPCYALRQRYVHEFHGQKLITARM
ncbi:hypothetical protein EE612_050313, partial [Oryza sativa]